MNTLDNIFVKYGKNQTLEFKDFLNVKAEELSEREQQLQSVMSSLYHLNDRKPPLFHSFPNWRSDKPLTIDAISLPLNTDAQASFSGEENVVRFESTDTTENLLLSLGHELKHAEQCSREFWEMRKESNLAYHQLTFLEEAQAYAFETYLSMLYSKEKGITNFESITEKTMVDLYAGDYLPTLEKYYTDSLKNNTTLDASTIQQDLICSMLPNISSWSGYKEDFDKSHPINDSDTDISHIPESFALDYGFVHQKLMPILKQIPHEVKDPVGRFRQLLSNGHEEEAKEFLPKNEEERSSLLKSEFENLTSSLPSNWPQIENQKDLDNYEKKLCSKLKFLIQYPQETLSDESELSWCVTDAIKMGMPHLIKDLLTAKKQDGKRALSDKETNELFEYVLFREDLFDDEMSPQHLTLAQKQLGAMAETFLDLKDEKGKPIITNGVIKRIRENKDSTHILNGYMRKHPNDTRFHKTNILEILSSASNTPVEQQVKQPLSQKEVSEKNNNVENKPTNNFYTKFRSWFSRG